MNILTANALTAGLTPVTITELAPATRIALRLADRATAAAALGLDLPERIGTRAAAGERSALCLGPDEWLLQAPAAREQDLVEALRQALAGRHAAVTGLSGGQTVVGLQGAAAALVLAKGCTLDLHPRAFRAEDCAQTRLAKANVLAHRLPPEGEGFELTVRRSFADYLWRWLADAGAEHGLAAPAPAPQALALAA